MRRTFVRALAVNAVAQFIITRRRAGLAEEEGQAELLWLRYPAVVLANALLWTLTFAALARVGRAIRGA